MTTKMAVTHRWPLWIEKTVREIAAKLGIDKTQTLIVAIREFALKTGLIPRTPCLNMLAIKQNMQVTCRLHGEVNGIIKCLGEPCPEWRDSASAPLQEQAVKDWQINKGDSAKGDG